MSKEVINIEYDPYTAFGYNELTWGVLKQKIIDYLDSRNDERTVPSEDVRNIDEGLQDDRVWGQITSELEINEIECQE